MRIPTEFLGPVFMEVKKVKDALDAYCLAPNKIPVSLDDLEFAIKQLYGFTVVKKLVPVKSDKIRGAIDVYSDRADVFLNSDLNLAQTRYTFTKELSHLMLMNADNCTDDPTLVIQYLIQDGFYDDAGGERKDVLSEVLTKFSAVELLFPFQLRDGAKKRIDAEQETLFTTSEWLEIPEHIVEYALSDRYMALAAHFWSK